MNNQNNNPCPARPRRPSIEPIPVTYTELFPRLIQGQLLARVPLTPMEPPYPYWYDANATCDYHYGIKGHSTENYLALKNQIQALKNARYINFGFNKDVARILLAILCPIIQDRRLTKFWKALWMKERPMSKML